MSIGSYNVGDHVVVETCNVPGWNLTGKTGIIRKIDMNYRYPYLIKMDEDRLPVWCTVRSLVE